MADKKRIAPGADNESVRPQTVIHDALNLACVRLRWRAALRGFASSIWLPVLAAAGWIAAVRFTLLDLPRWPVTLVLVAWFAAYFVWLRRLYITQSRCARYLDAILGLDERLSTYIELEGRDRLNGQGQAANTSAFKNMLAFDTATLLTERVTFLPGKLRYKGELWASLATWIAVLVLVGALFVPTQLDRIKTERDIVRVTLDAQAQKLADLRAEIVARPDIPNDLKQNLASELDALEKQLRAQQIDKADALATIADTEQKIRDLAPTAASTDFEPVTNADDLVRNSIANVTNATNSANVSTGELHGYGFNSAAEAIRDLKPILRNLSTIQARRLASDLERAANSAAPKDPQLAQNLQDAAAAVRSSNWDRAASSLDEASKRFQDASAQQQMAQAVENTLAKLEDGRQSIAKAGATAAKRGQVGFRRGNPAQTGSDGGQTANAEGTPDASQNSSLINSRIGQNQAAYGAGGGGSGQQSSQSGAGSNGTGQNGGQGGQPTGNSGAGQQPGSAGSGGGAGTGSQGSNLGRINGPIRGAGGSQNPTGDAQGYGVSAGGSQAQGGQSNDQSAERIYVPGKSDDSQSGMAGQAAPEQAPSGSALAGRAGQGQAGDSTPSGVGLGSITTIHTPYTQVLGQYSNQAIQALDRAYVPPDAKDYVRDYFAALGK